jgi:hypothetical protein
MSAKSEAGGSSFDVFTLGIGFTGAFDSHTLPPYLTGELQKNGTAKGGIKEMGFCEQLAAARVTTGPSVPQKKSPRATDLRSTPSAEQDLSPQPPAL